MEAIASVASVTRGINVANAEPNGQGLAAVNPIFTCVQLAPRILVCRRLGRAREKTTNDPRLAAVAASRS